jgi:hypothetical protein
LNNNVHTTYTEKRNKYVNMAQEIKKKHGENEEGGN